MNTTAILVVAAIGFAISAGSGYFLIPYLHKLKFGQTILDIGPSWHKNKQGTPTMGGFMFILAVLIASVVGYFMLDQGEIPSGMAPRWNAPATGALSCWRYPLV